MSQLELLSQLKDQLVTFFDELIELLPEEPDLVIVRIFIKDKIPITDIMDYIVRELIPMKKMICQRNDEFFLKHNILFSKLDPKKVNYFKQLWTSKYLDKNNKETIWKWFFTFVYLAEKYQKKSG